jgi:uncharacterized protein (DUF885 family)
MSSAAARGEAVKNSMFPGAALIYLVGSDLIRRLRGRAKALDLKAFHDRLLEQGSLPIALITPEMLAPELAGSPP